LDRRVAKKAPTINSKPRGNFVRLGIKLRDIVIIFGGTLINVEMI